MLFEENFKNIYKKMTEVKPINDQATGLKIGKFKASWLIAMASWNLIKQDKEVLTFPILSAIFMFVVTGVIGIIFYLLVLGGQLSLTSGVEGSTATASLSNVSYFVEVIYAFVLYFITTFITLFFETGIITIIKGRLSGQDLTFNDGIENARKKIKVILIWSFVSATVGTFLKIISDRSKLVGKIITALLGSAWSILTFFIAPIIIVENLTIQESLKKSAETIKRVWGESAIIGVGTGLAFFFLYLFGILAFIALIFTLNKFLIIGGFVLFVIYLIILSAISSALSVVFRVVLYEYASTGQVPAGFTADILKMAIN